MVVVVVLWRGRVVVGMSAGALAHELEAAGEQAAIEGVQGLDLVGERIVERAEADGEHAKDGLARFFRAAYGTAFHKAPCFALFHQNVEYEVVSHLGNLS